MIKTLVSELPEIYQPIFDHPELSDQVSRPCADRLAKITQIYDALQRLLGRPLRVLDLGCAQGYFSLSLARHGANVQGIDFLDKNIAVCNALAQEHPELHVNFKMGRIEDIVEQLEIGQYDLVLGLSVFHHIVHEKGILSVKALLENIASHAAVLILELALREEPLYWALTQPKDPRELMEGIAYVHELARHSTHLAPIPRPLFIASNLYWALDDDVEKIQEWSHEPHALADGTHQDSRRYFFSEESFLKLYRLDHPRGSFNKIEFEKEVEFLKNPPPGFLSPKLLYFGENQNGAWIVAERLRGRLLLDILRENLIFDRRALIVAVLQQLVVLEKQGLYHNDVRTWNVLVGDAGATYIIDCGSITTSAQDCAWPGNIFLSFFVFVKEVATGVVENPNDSLRTIAISPFGLPQPYHAWAHAFWHRPLVTWSFELMYQTLLHIPQDVQDTPLQEPMNAWMKAIEDALQGQKVYMNRIRYQPNTDKHQSHLELLAMAESHENDLTLLKKSFHRLEQALQGKIPQAEAFDNQLSWVQQQFENSERKLSILEEKSANFELRAISAENSVREHEKKIDELGGSSHYWWQQSNTLQAECNALKASWSWRITAPVRWAASFIMHPGQGFRSVANCVIRNAIVIFRKPLSKLMAAILRRPVLSYRINQWLMHRFPALRQQLLEAAWHDGLVYVATQSQSQSQSPAALAREPVERSLTHITPHARQIYIDIQAALDKSNRTD